MRHSTMAGIEAASLDAVVQALRQAGYRPEVRAASGQGSTCAPVRGVWIEVPGEDMAVVVVLTGLHHTPSNG
jgi:hypothetical protein